MIRGFFWRARARLGRVSLADTLGKPRVDDRGMIIGVVHPRHASAFLPATSGTWAPTPPRARQAILSTKKHAYALMRVSRGE
jgi:hypothetical protein